VFYCIAHASRDIYWLYKDVCEIPPNIYPKLELKSVSRAVCRLACSEIYDKQCSGFLYSRQERSCTLSPYTGERIPTGMADCDSLSGFEFYRRTRLLGKIFTSITPATCRFRSAVFASYSVTMFVGRSVTATLRETLSL